MNAPLTHPVTGEAEVFADGLYFGLDEDVYHADPALGSTDIKRLYASPPDFWWHWKQNPFRPEDTDTPARLFGRAVHCRVLEGREAFEAKYAATDLPGNIKAGKEERERITSFGMTPIKRADYERIQIAGAMIAKNPDFEKAFEGGYSEVSIFWTVEHKGMPVRLKARFDYLKPRAIADLKSVANQNSIHFPKACLNALCNYRYDMQAGHYLSGRSMVPAMVKAGAVHGKVDAEWLARVAGEEAFAWVWVFYQSSDSPISWGKILSPENPIVTYARDHVAVALDNFVDFSRAFAPGEVWIMREPLTEIDLTDMPGWFGR